MKLTRIVPAIVLALSSLSHAATDTVKASAFGFNAEDATGCLQKALDSDAKTVIVDNMGTDWIVRPLLISRSNVEVVLEDNVVIMAKKDEFKGTSQSLFKVASDATHVTIRGGKNSVLRMRKQDYMDPRRYKHAEWRHGINASGVEHLTVKNLLIQSTGGDGIYLGCNGKKACNHILVENCVFDDNNRMGLTVIGSCNTLVRNCIMKNTYGTPPQAGIGIEPNNAYGFMTNLVFENCDCFNNAWIGGYLHNWSLDPAITPPISVTFKNCNFHDNKNGGFSIYGVKAKPGRKVVHGTADLVNCNFTADTGYALFLNNLTADGFKVTLKDCTASATDKGYGVVRMSTEMFEPFSNVDFGNLAMRDQVKRPPIKVAAMLFQGIEALYGNPTAAVGDEQPAPVDLAAILKAFPAQKNLSELQNRTLFDPMLYTAATDKAVKAGEKYRFRGGNRFVQCVKQGTTARVHLKNTAINEKVKVVSPVKVVISDKTNTPSKDVMVGPTEQVVELTAYNTDQVYTFQFTGNNPILVWSETPGNGFVADNLSIITSPTTWYFQVPAKLEEVRILVNASEYESVVACIYDANGKPTMKPEHATDMAFLRVKRKPTATDETWSIRFTNVVEDYSFSLMGGLPPVVFTAPENAIVQK